MVLGVKGDDMRLRWKVFRNHVRSWEAGVAKNYLTKIFVLMDQHLVYSFRKKLPILLKILLRE